MHFTWNFWDIYMFFKCYLKIGLEIWYIENENGLRRNINGKCINAVECSITIHSIPFAILVSLTLFPVVGLLLHDHFLFKSWHGWGLCLVVRGMEMVQLWFLWIVLLASLFEYRWWWYFFHWELSQAWPGYVNRAKLGSGFLGSACLIVTADVTV